VNQKKVVMITGAYPPEFCGVGDYTCKLVEVLRQKGLGCELFHKSDWSLRFFLNYYNELRSKQLDFYHFQYPTEGYGYSILPLLLVILLPYRKTIITVHELSSRNLLAYFYTIVLIFFSKNVIVSNEIEQAHARKFIFNKKKVKIIPVASNIKTSSFAKRTFAEREIDLCYFGHIRPIKGIEDYIETVSFLSKSIKPVLIGQLLEKYRLFGDSVVDRAKVVNISIIENRSEDEIADILSNVKIAYLPFPDGISNRRGSLLACVQNGCIIVSRRSKYEQFNVFFDRYCYLTDTNEAAVLIISKLLAGVAGDKDVSGLKGIFSWENIAVEHLYIYTG
jgi:glycosyltransferase involved in cell wall biosynthesis